MKMKKLLYLLISILLFCSNLNIIAQKEEPIKNKTYDVKNYVFSKSDPHDPFKIALSSFIIPGLGQMECGVPAKGILFLLASASGWIPTISGLKLLLWTDSGKPEPNWTVRSKIAHQRMALGLSISAVFWIWSIIDASRTAKIQNLKYRQANGTIGSINISPYLTAASSYANGRYATGLSINIKF
jgi:hypothetical protein